MLSGNFYSQYFTAGYKASCASSRASAVQRTAPRQSDDHVRAGLATDLRRWLPHCEGVGQTRDRARSRGCIEASWDQPTSRKETEAVVLLKAASRDWSHFSRIDVAVTCTKKSIFFAKMNVTLQVFKHLIFVALICKNKNVIPFYLFCVAGEMIKRDRKAVHRKKQNKL